MANFTGPDSLDVPFANFLGRGWSFPTEFAAADGRLPLHLKLATTEEDIWQSLHILFHTEPGERIMNPAYGCALRQYLFEPMDVAAITRLKATIDLAVLNFESRIKLLDVTVSADHLTEGLLLLELSYEVRTLNSRHNAVFPFQREATLLAGSLV